MTQPLLTIDRELGTQGFGEEISHDLQVWLADSITEDVDMRCHRLAKHLEDLAIQLRHGIGPFTGLVTMAKQKRVELISAMTAIATHAAKEP